MIDVTLRVNGTNYRGWKRIDISAGIEQIAGSFNFLASDRWHGQDKPWAIKKGDECSVYIGGQRVIKGYVDDANPEYDAHDHGINVTGRDVTGDLVDCSAIYKSGEWHKAKLTKIASDLCAPFGISVKADVDVGKAFPKFALQDGEAVFEALERAAKQRGVLLVSDAAGGLLITRAGLSKIETALVRGKNIERGSGTFSHKDRFSQYIIKGQSPGSDDYSEPEHHTQVKAAATDADVQRYRPLIIYAEQGDGSTYAQRAVWERNVRAGRSSRMQYTVTGWEYASGLIWQPNKMVSVIDDYMGVASDFLIVSCTYLLDDAGSRTVMELCRREAFDLINMPGKKQKKDKESI